MEIRSILVPTDFSADANHALEVAADLALKFEARIVLLHAFAIDLPLAGAAYGGGVILPDDFYSQYRDQAMAEVAKVAKDAGARRGVEIEGLAIQQAPWVAIVEQAEKSGVDLIVMGTRGLTGIKHVAFGSTAERVVRTAKSPVLTVKAD